MNTYTLLPKLNHIGSDISDSQTEYVLYRHSPYKTTEFNVVKTDNVYRFLEAEFKYTPCVQNEDKKYLAYINGRIKKVS